MKISLRSNIRSIRVFRSFEYNQTFSNIEYRGEREREKKKETAENRKEQLDKVRRKVRERERPRGKISWRIGGKKSLVAGEGERGQSTVINNQEERWFRPTSQSHRAKIRARRGERYSVQAASWRFLAGCPPSIDYAIVVPGRLLSHPHYRGPTCDQTRQIFVVSEGQLLFCE